MNPTILLATVFALAAAPALGACGEKPKPRPRATSNAPATPTPEPGPSGPGEAPLTTAGGVSLVDAPPRAAAAAAALSRRPDSATRQLISAGPRARPLARALLDSLNLAEVEGALAYFAAVPDDGALTDIARLIGHDSAAIRAAARHALEGRRGSPLAQVVAPLAEDDRPAVRVAAIRTLSGIGGLLARTALLNRLADADDAVVLEAASALARLGPPVDAAALDAIFADPKARPAQLRAAFTVARRAGGRIPAAAARVALAAPSADAPVSPLALEAARAFPRVAWDDPAAELKTLSADPRPAIRRALLEGLVELGGDDRRAAIEHLATAALDSANVPLRIAGATALAHLVPAPARSAARTTPIVAPPSGDDADKATLQAVPATDAVHFAPATFGTVPDRLLALLTDPAPALRRTATVLLVETLPGPIVAFRVDKRLDDEGDATTQRLMLAALARIGTRDALSRVIARLDSPTLGKMAHQALVLFAGDILPRDAAAWTAWLEKRFAPPVAKVPRTAPSDDNATATTNGSGQPATDEVPPGTIPRGEPVEPLPDGTIPAHYDEKGRWVPHKPPPLPPGYKKPDRQRPQLTNVPG